MKLNLLPTYVSKEKATRSAFIIAVLIFLICVGAAVGLIKKGTGDYQDSLNGIADARGLAAKAKGTADYADEVMLKSTTLLRNAGLAKAMAAHNPTYSNLYDEVKRYIPSFYRVNSMSAQPGGPTTAQITLVGVLDSDQQYADLMLALLRWKRVQSLTRGGFTDTNPYVPGLTPDDQVGKPIKPGDSPIPDDPNKRLDYFMAKGRVSGYQATGGFGSGQPGAIGAMPGASVVTITMVVDIGPAPGLQTPDPRATLAAGGAASSGGTGGPNATGGNLPASTPTTPAPGNPAPSGDTARVGRGKRGASSDDNGD